MVVALLGVLKAGAAYVRAMQLSPGNLELLFWGGLGLAQQNVEAGAGLVQQAIEAHPGWAELLARLDAGIAPAAESVRRILDEATG